MSLIFREGIKIEKNNLRVKDSENKKSQVLIDCFNIIGTSNPKMWIGVQKEHIGNNSYREDIYFYLNDDLRTRIFYTEAKRLPKNNSIDEEEYVKGISTTGKPCGGIERFILGIHGDSETMNNYGMIGYIENKNLCEWLSKINTCIESNYPLNSGILNPLNKYDFLSEHSFECQVTGKFNIYHFWIDLTEK